MKMAAAARKSRPVGLRRKAKGAKSVFANIVSWHDSKAYIAYYSGLPALVSDTGDTCMLVWHAVAAFAEL